MIARLSGTVLEKHPMRVVLDVGGVGYDVHVPLSSFSAVGDPGSRLTLRVHTHVREDALVLYGFAIGARTARLRAADRGQRHRTRSWRCRCCRVWRLRNSCRPSPRANVARLTSIPGIGRKTAERIVLELKDKLAAMATTGAIATPAGPREDLVSALLNLGLPSAGGGERRWIARCKMDRI